MGVGAIVVAVVGIGDSPVDVPRGQRGLLGVLGGVVGGVLGRLGLGGKPGGKPGVAEGALGEPGGQARGHRGGGVGGAHRHRCRGVGAVLGIGTVSAGQAHLFLIFIDELEKLTKST